MDLYNNYDREPFLFVVRQLKNFARIFAAERPEDLPKIIEVIKAAYHKEDLRRFIPEDKRFIFEPDEHYFQELSEREKILSDYREDLYSALKSVSEKQGNPFTDEGIKNILKNYQQRLDKILDSSRFTFLNDIYGSRGAQRNKLYRLYAGYCPSVEQNRLQNKSQSVQGRLF